VLTLGIAQYWQLPADRWDEVARVLDRLDRAVRTPDTGAFDEAANDLLILGPTRRVDDVGGPVSQPAPPKIRERLNTLIHTLTETPAGITVPPERPADPPGRR